MLNIFRNRMFFAVCTGHLSVDIMNSIGPVLLAVLATPLALSNAQIGFALTWYTFAGSLSQPVFGWLSDRVRGRPVALAGIGVLWMTLCFTAVALFQHWYLILSFFILAAFGSGLFHPIGTMSAAVAHPEQAGRSTAVFFFCGQVGLALGPVLGGLLFGFSGSLGVLPLATAALLPATLMLLSPAPRVSLDASKQRARTIVRTSVALIAAFVALVALRSSIQATYAAFLPKLFADRGWDPAMFGLLAGTFMFAAAIGNIITGEVADRYSMRAATVGPLLLGVGAGLVCIWAPTPVTAFVACALAGLLIGGQHSVLVVHAQRLIPAQQGFAAGLILGFTFAAGGIGIWLTGIVADYVGLNTAMQGLTLLGLPAALLAWTLPGRSSETPIVTPIEA
jgi:FSR family fosmidomycin resistance protein-like MFS transporter